MSLKHLKQVNSIEICQPEPVTGQQANLIKFMEHEMKSLLFAFVLCFAVLTVPAFASSEKITESWVAQGVRVVTQDNVQGSTSFEFKYDGFANKQACEDYVTAQNDLEMVNSWDGVTMGQRVSALCLQVR